MKNRNAPNSTRLFMDHLELNVRKGPPVFWHRRRFCSLWSDRYMLTNRHTIGGLK